MFWNAKHRSEPARRAQLIRLRDVIGSDASLIRDKFGTVVPFDYTIAD